MSAYEVKESHLEHYRFLEALRKSGATNMWGATPYLEEAYGLPHDEAVEILCEWISNYDEIDKRWNIR